ncbi:MAG: hypothetical protein BWX52_00940 [Bacteroidetes bacterium ADurb.Bin013]|nr:MAG: hypothetical protein BWX52_00940 [Bacteroidetes bacterium ADurb.Bin013]
MVEQPLEPFVGRDDTECQTIGLNPQDDLVIRHGNGSSMSCIFKVRKENIRCRVPVRPEALVKIHGIEVSLSYMRHYIGIPVTEIDQVQVVFFNAVNKLCTQNPGRARDNYNH